MNRPEVDWLDADERAAIILLAEYDLTTDEILELINLSFKQRYEEILIRDRRSESAA